MAHPALPSRARRDSNMSTVEPVVRIGSNRKRASTCIHCVRNQVARACRRRETFLWIAIDEVAWLADRRSGDATRQTRALHAACPCSGSSELYERYMPQLHELKKDPRSAVRRVALDLVEDALDVSAMADEQGNGFRRNRPGGWGQEGEPRRKVVRLGLRDRPARARGRTASES